MTISSYYDPIWSVVFFLVIQPTPQKGDPPNDRCLRFVLIKWLFSRCGWLSNSSNPTKRIETFISTIITSDLFYLIGFFLFFLRVGQSAIGSFWPAPSDGAVQSPQVGDPKRAEEVFRQLPSWQLQPDVPGPSFLCHFLVNPGWMKTPNGCWKLRRYHFSASDHDCSGSTSLIHKLWSIHPGLTLLPNWLVDD